MNYSTSPLLGLTQQLQQIRIRFIQRNRVFICLWNTLREQKVRRILRIEHLRIRQIWSILLGILRRFDLGNETLQLLLRLRVVQNNWLRSSRKSRWTGLKILKQFLDSLGIRNHSFFGHNAAWLVTLILLGRHFTLKKVFLLTYGLGWNRSHIRWVDRDHLKWHLRGFLWLGKILNRIGKHSGLRICLHWPIGV